MKDKIIKVCPACNDKFEAKKDSKELLCPICNLLLGDSIGQEDLAENSVSEAFGSYKEAKCDLQKLNMEQSPQKIKEYLDEYIIGQEQAKKTLSVALFNHVQRIAMKERCPEIKLEKSNVILVGPSGCGKTHLIKTLASLFDLPCCICDATSMTESGYVGADVETVLQKLYFAANGNVKLAEKGIVFIDEIDKKAGKSKANTSITRDVSGEGVQQALLKLIEGNNVDVQLNGERRNPYGDTVTINTENILFIVSGAFPGIEKLVEKRIFNGKEKSVKINGIKGNNVDQYEKDYNDVIKYLNSEDLISFGMIPELVGRIPVISYVNQLTRDELLDIIVKPKNAILKQYETMFDMNGKSLVFEQAALEKIADYAIKNKIGARSLRTELEGVLLEPMFNMCEMSDPVMVITEADVDKYHNVHIACQRTA